MYPGEARAQASSCSPTTLCGALAWEGAGLWDFHQALGFPGTNDLGAFASEDFTIVFPMRLACSPHSGSSRRAELKHCFV